MNMNHILAIAEKDFKEFMKNMMLLMMPIIPILMAFIFDKQAKQMSLEDKGIIIIIVVMIAFGSILTISLMTMFAEENEKHTLRGLINSPATLFDIVVGKSFVVIIITAITTAVVLFIFKENIFDTVPMIIGGLLMVVFFLLIGVAIGLNVKTVAITSAYTLPILFIFVMGDMFTNMFDKDNILVKIIENTPASQYRILYETGDIKHLFIILAWVAIGIIFTLWSFRKASIDK